MCLSAPCLLFTFLQFQFHAANASRRKRLVKRSEQFEAILLQIFISMEFSHHSPSNSARDIGVHNQIVENPCFPLRQTISVDIKCFTMLLGKGATQGSLCAELLLKLRFIANKDTIIAFRLVSRFHSEVHDLALYRSQSYHVSC